MGQSCKTPQLNAIHGLPLQKTSNNLCETASFQQKSEPESPFCHLSQVVTSKIRELNYKPEQLQSIAKYPIHQLPNGLIYQGPLQNNHMNGPCRLAMPDGSYYQGEMAGNQLNGEGLLINPRGQYYIGSFKDNKAEGKGMYVGEDFIYEGEFKKNVYSGKGKLTKLDQIFEGVFEKGKMKKGKLIKLSEQSVYEGEFQGNIENGFGRSTKNNSTYQGIFKNGLIQGEGKVKEENGEELICSFQRGAIVSVIRLSATEGENKQSQQFLSLRGTNHQTV